MFAVKRKIIQAMICELLVSPSIPAFCVSLLGLCMYSPHLGMYSMQVSVMEFVGLSH